MSVVSFARSVIPLDDERCESLLRGSHMVGDDGDGIVEADDLARLERPSPSLRQRASRGRRTHGDCASVAIFTPGARVVDAVDSRSIDLRRRIEALHQLADEPKFLRSLERHLREGSCARLGGESPYRIFFSRWAGGSLPRFARGTPVDPRSSALPQPPRASFSQSHRLRA